MHGGQRQKSLYGDAVFAAKPAAKTRRGYMNPLGWDPQGFGQLQTVTERRLSGNRHVQFAGLIDEGHPVLRLQESVLLPAKRDREAAPH